MRRTQLAKHLISAANATVRKEILTQNARLADAKFAEEIKSQCYVAWTTDPIKAQQSAAALASLSKFNNTDEIRAFSLWVNGIANITKGKFDAAICSLDRAAEIFIQIERADDAAQTKVANLLASAMLGRYDEAIQSGRDALRTFIKSGDQLAAGKIEMNLSNIVSRQARHLDAEKYCASARRRFIKAGERSWQAMAENGLANTYAELNSFDRSERFYQMALVNARAEKMLVTEAEVEASLGNLATLRGRYADALKYLEMSRQKFDGLGMPHQSAIADLEIAGIYSELNLGTEAFAIYEQVTEIFRKLKLRAEEARARLEFGRTAANLGDRIVAKRELKRGLRLFALENNDSGQMAVRLAQAALAIDENLYKDAIKILSAAAASIKDWCNPRQLADLKLLNGKAFLSLGDYRAAEQILTAAREMAVQGQYQYVVHSALTSLGKIAELQGETSQAKSCYTKAIRVVEGLRSSLAADEFSMSFLASRLEPYAKLTKVLINERKFTEAFAVIESGRSRSLLDAMYLTPRQAVASPALQRQQEELRSELNFHYRRLESSAAKDLDRIRSDAQKAEAALADNIRKIASVSAKRNTTREHEATGVSLNYLKQKLGKKRTFIEYVELDGKISVFVVNEHGVKFFSDLARPVDIDGLIEELHFQFGAMRYGAGKLGRFTADLKKRCDGTLAKLYDLLVRPFSEYLSGDSLVIVPVGSLHYVPFHALRDENGYMIERFEIGHAPSASVWSRLQERRPKPIKNSLLMGYADERIPLVEQEIRQIRRAFPDSKSLVGKRATFSAYIENAPAFDLIHLACHGQFRPENPMFSSLHLADGWITVQDICSQKLKASLVTLSACETGVNRIFAGDEILGLVRGFISAGASSLIVSLWTLNDEAAGKLMKQFYTNLQRGESIAASLRQAQLDFVRNGEHPFLWSPFILIGR